MEQDFSCGLSARAAMNREGPDGRTATSYLKVEEKASFKAATK